MYPPIWVFFIQHLIKNNLKKKQCTYYPTGNQWHELRILSRNLAKMCPNWTWNIHHSQIFFVEGRNLPLTKDPLKYPFFESFTYKLYLKVHLNISLENFIKNWSLWSLQSTKNVAHMIQKAIMTPTTVCVVFGWIALGN